MNTPHAFAPVVWAGFVRWLRPALILTAVLTAFAGVFSAAAADRAGGGESNAPPKRVIVPKLRGPIVVDGRLDESVWSKAARLSPFLKNDGSGSEREKTELRLWYDDAALYLGWKCMDTDIQATLTARDSKFWEEEVVEFFVTPAELTRYFELQWNPLGGVFDAIIDNTLDERGRSRNFKGEWSFTAKGMTNAVEVKGTVGRSEDQDQFWAVEVRLPFAGLNQPPPPAGAVWRGNFYRFNRTKGRPAELLSWTPTFAPSFHEPARFGYLQFGK